VPQLAQILLGRQLDAGTALGIAGLVEDEDALGMGLEPGMRPPERQALLVEGVGIPRRIVENVVQRLPPRARHDRGQFDDGLVVLARQQQANQIVAHRFPLLGPAEEVVEGVAELVDRLGGRRDGFAWGRHGSCSSRWNAAPAAALPPPLLHVSCHK